MRCLSVFFAFVLIKNGNADCLDVITRDEWGATKGAGVDYIIFPVHNVIVHHTVSSACHTQAACSKYMRNLQSYFINTAKFHDIAYNFLIGGDGKVYEGVGWHKLGAHTRGYNSRSIGIAFIGNYEAIKPSAEQLQALKNILSCGVVQHELEPDYKLYGGRQVRKTLSPGQKVYDEIKTWNHFTTKP